MDSLRSIAGVTADLPPEQQASLTEMLLNAYGGAGPGPGQLRVPNTFLGRAGGTLYRGGQAVAGQLAKELAQQRGVNALLGALPKVPGAEDASAVASPFMQALPEFKFKPGGMFAEREVAGPAKTSEGAEGGTISEQDIFSLPKFAERIVRPGALGGIGEVGKVAGQALPPEPTPTTKAKKPFIPTTVAEYLATLPQDQRRRAAALLVAGTSPGLLFKAPEFRTETPGSRTVAIGAGGKATTVSEGGPQITREQRIVGDRYEVVETRRHPDGRIEQEIIKGLGGPRQITSPERQELQKLLKEQRGQSLLTSLNNMATELSETIKLGALQEPRRLAEAKALLSEILAQLRKVRKELGLEPLPEKPAEPPPKVTGPGLTDIRGSFGKKAGTPNYQQLLDEIAKKKGLNR